MNKKNFRSTAFTLVELLVVISIIALLLSILMPSLNKAREQAIRIVCAANMKSTGTSMAMYLDDNKGVFPPDYMPPRATVKEDFTENFWQQRLVAYTKNGKVFTCSNYEKYYAKSFATANPKTDLYGSKNKDNNWYYWYCSGTAPSFGFNHRALGCGGWSQTGFGCISDSDAVRTGNHPHDPANLTIPSVQVKQNQIKNASNVILCLDNVSSIAQPPPITTQESWDWWANGDPRDRTSSTGYHPKRFRHANGMNMLYVDCHADYKKIDAPGMKFVQDTLDPCWGKSLW